MSGFESDMPKRFVPFMIVNGVRPKARGIAKRRDFRVSFKMSAFCFRRVKREEVLPLSLSSPQFSGTVGSGGERTFN